MIFNPNIDLIASLRPLLNLTEAHGAGKWNRDILTSLELGRIRVAATAKRGKQARDIETF